MDTSSRKRVIAAHPVHNAGRSIGYIFGALCPPRPHPDLEMKAFVSSLDPDRAEKYLVPVLPRDYKALAYRLNLVPWLMGRRLLKELDQFDACYLWPHVDLATFRGARKRKKPIFTERINCSRVVARSILEDAYKKLSVRPQHGLSESLVKAEIEETKLADFIFCPSPRVVDSFLQIGVPKEKLLLTSYGWEAKRFHSSIQGVDTCMREEKDGITILFVGYVCVRKGAHLLIDYFLKSGINGRLILCGEMDSVVAETCKEHLKSEKIVHLQYTPSVGRLFREADVFAFPTLEEGGPQVTYEAMAHGLPVLVSPMGAGAVARDGMDGWVLPPYASEAWIEKLRELERTPSLRLAAGKSAYFRAQEFEYGLVAKRRAELFLRHL